MKKKYLSIVSSVLSLTAALLFLVIAILFAVRLSQGKEYVPQVSDSFWLKEVIDRLKKVGFNVFFSIIGIILSVVLAIYRLALTYFYLKIFRGDEDFYKERRKEIIFFSALAAIVSVIAFFIYANKNLIPLEFRTLCLILAIVYALVCLLPIGELVAVSVINYRLAKEKGEKIPDKDDIISELDELAEETAEKVHESVIRENCEEKISEEENDA